MSSSDSNTEFVKITFLSENGGKKIYVAQVKKEYIKDIPFFSNMFNENFNFTECKSQDLTITLKDEISQQNIINWLMFHKYRAQKLQPQLQPQPQPSFCDVWIGEYFMDEEYLQYIIEKMTLQDMSASLQMFEMLQGENQVLFFTRYLSLTTEFKYKKKCGYCYNCVEASAIKRRIRQIDDKIAKIEKIKKSNLKEARDDTDSYSGYLRDHILTFSVQDKTFWHAQLQKLSPCSSSLKQNSESNGFFERMHKFCYTDNKLANMFWKIFLVTAEQRESLVDFFGIPKKRQAAFIKSKTFDDFIKYLEVQWKLILSEDDSFRYKQCDTRYWDAIVSAHQKLETSKQGESVGSVFGRSGGGAVYIDSDKVSAAENKLNDAYKEADKNLASIQKKENAKDIMQKNYETNSKEKKIEKKISNDEIYKMFGIKPSWSDISYSYQETIVFNLGELVSV